MSRRLVFVLALVLASGSTFAGKIVFIPMETNLEPFASTTDEISMSKSVPWSNAKGESGDVPVGEFIGAEPRQLSFDLSFDTSQTKEDVYIKHVQQIEKMAMIHQSLGRPPMVKVVWGKGMEFKGVLESFTVKFTLFLDDGTPVRAVMNCVFKEYSAVIEQRGQPRH